MATQYEITLTVRNSKGRCGECPFLRVPFQAQAECLLFKETLVRDYSDDKATSWCCCSSCRFVTESAFATVKPVKVVT